MANNNDNAFVNWFRNSSPYINAHRGRTFVVVFGGEAVSDAGFPNLVHDIALLNTLGVRLVLVHGARPQIEQRLQERGAEMHYVSGLRVTDDAALACVKEAAGTVRVEIEALFSMGLANSPMAGARIRVASGNFVTARPLGVRDGVDYRHTGEVRRVDIQAIQKNLEEGAIVVLSPIGYSPTGEVFNLSAEDVATSVAIELHADKLLYLMEAPGLMDARKQLIQQLTLLEAEQVLDAKRKIPGEIKRHLASAIRACKHGVRRAHLISRHIEGALLLELFTRDGAGTLITAKTYDDTRQATIEDVGGILELIQPLEVEGVMVRRSRERLEMEIDHFVVMERDGMVIACAALYPFADEKVAELACFAVHPDYRNAGRGDALLELIEDIARQKEIRRLFVLTTHTAHWFVERGFAEGKINQLPLTRQAFYNYQRKSKVFIKTV
ncbi:MAG TPA: amino-acid N-acetyltransferase [Gammaproteobacteria bacterium]|nr:amino-acid N-acetyltransferase [Gammaproteobacteria bacterium]